MVRLTAKEWDGLVAAVATLEADVDGADPARSRVLAAAERALRKISRSPLAAR